MKEKSSFLRQVCNLAIPVALQSMLQSSFSIVDQIMIGQLGSIPVAGVGLAAKFASIFSVILSAVGAVTGIMLSQYLGQKNQYEWKRSFRINLAVAGGIAAAFTALCVLFPEGIMGFYTEDPQVKQEAAAYLRILAVSFLPMAGATLLATQLRCMEKARLPLYASILSAVANTVLNYFLIFGVCGFPKMGAEGAAIATVAAQLFNVLFMLVLFFQTPALKLEQEERQPEAVPFQWRPYFEMLLPLLVCETAWSLGENVYAAIYAHMGTQSSAAMTLLNPVQGLMTGALCGLSQAAGVFVGKRLGSGEYETAYQEAKQLLWYGTAGSLLLSGLVLLIHPFYAEIYQVEEAVKLLTSQILVSYALVAPCKVLNMILGGGILRSGGKTNYIMVIDLIGTWGIGVPLGLFSAFVLNGSIPVVYFMLSLEEGVRFLISLWVFRRRKWMQSRFFTTL